MTNEKTRFLRIGRFLPGLLSALLVCSCASAPPAAIAPAGTLPADTHFNKGAGRGSHLYLTLRLESGEKLPFIVDTGSSHTILDQSLVPKLGRRLDTTFLWYPYYGLREVGWHGVYQTPALYLGKTRLLTPDRICTDDLRTKSRPGHPIKGILGMDCLEHYCLQLDFETDTLHFLDPDQPQTAALGEAFPLTFEDGTDVSTRANFFGATNTRIFLDTGDSSDGGIKGAIFRRELKRQKPPATNRWEDARGSSFAHLPEGTFAADTYTDFFIHKCPLLLSLEEQRIVGLRFLARHLVTLNFPKHTLYLQRRSLAPLPDGIAEIKNSLGFVNDQPPKDLDTRFEAMFKPTPGGQLLSAASDFLAVLKKQGQLPGWQKNDHGYEKVWMDTESIFEFQEPITEEDYPVARTITVFKEKDPSVYNYTVVQASKDAPWHLQRAWKADAGGRVLRDYPIP